MEYIDIYVGVVAMLLLSLIITMGIMTLLLRAVIFFPIKVRKDGWEIGFRKYQISVLLSAVLLILALYGAWWWNIGHWQRFIPDGMPVSKVIYQKQEVGGFGPGGNETGLAAYELPASTALEIQEQGIGYFLSLPQHPRKRNDWDGRYGRWERTPLPVDDRWSSGEGAKSAVPAYRIQNYLNRYGFGISIDTSIEQDIDEALSKPGSYFAYGRNGIIIVVPEQHRVYYAYNG